MRRALNILQACHAAFDRIDETAIYTCTGHPQPKDIQRIIDSMMNDDFTTAYSSKQHVNHVRILPSVLCNNSPLPL
jgi:replication factor C subunit 3/5